MPPRLTPATRRARIQADLDAGKLTLADLQLLLDANTVEPATESFKDIPELKPEPTTPPAAIDHFRFNLESVLAFVGAGIVCLGILVLLSFNWNSFSDAGQVLATLGTGVVVAVSSFFTQPLFQKTFYLNLTQLIAGGFLAFGISVLLTNYEPTAPIPLVYAACFGLVSLVYTALDRLYRQGVLTFLGLSFFALAYVSVVGHILEQASENYDVFELRIPQVAALALSLFYIHLALRIWDTSRVFFRAVILNLGAIGTMISTFLLVQYYEGLDAAWTGSRVLEHVYGLLFLGFYYLAVKLNSKFLLLSTSIGLFIWLNYLLAVVYDLSNNLGVGLIVSGFALILIGALTYRISKFLPRKNKPALK